MSNSKLVNVAITSPNKNSPRNSKITKITIHHMAGNMTVEACGNLFARASKKASANYGIGTDGRVGLYVDEFDRAWTSSNGTNDHQAVTIEVANDGGAPDWHVSDAAMAKLILLCTDICKRNGITALNYTGDKTGNLTRHNMFAATACPGPYLQSKFPYIAEEVNKRLAAPSAPIIVSTLLLKERAYSTATSLFSFGRKSGTYYFWDDAPVNGRRRMTNSPDKIGKPGQVSFWIKRS